MYFRIKPAWFLPTTLLLSVLLAATGVRAQDHGQANAADQPLIRFSTDAGEPVIEYTMFHHMLANQDPEALLRIYGNGRVHAHIPVYMNNAGDYEYRLSRPELDALLLSLSQDGVIDFDPGAARQERKQLEDQQRAAGILHYISDSSDTIINIRLDEYQRHPSASRIKDLNTRFTWKNLQQDAQQFPRSGAIKGAAASAQRLHDLLDHPGLQRIR